MNYYRARKFNDRFKYLKLIGFNYLSKMNVNNVMFIIFKKIKNNFQEK